MVKFSLTSEAEERLKSLQERMNDRGLELDVEEILELVFNMGLRQAERAMNILVPFDPEEGEEE